MIVEQGIISAQQGARLLATLSKLEQFGVDSLELDPHNGSMLFQIERFLIAELGEDLGGRLHIGRSRLDQGPTVRRLFKRNMLLAVLDGIVGLREALIYKAAANAAVVMPGYTCLQHAHPAIFGHYLLSFVSKLEDDFDRLVSAYGRLNLSPLGGAGLSGTSWPIDRKRTAALLGFDGVVKNAKLVREAYYAAEVASGLAMLMSTLNDLATDLHIWSSYEFGLVELDDAFCGTSSIFPQKKNPAALEAIKFLAGEAVSWPSIILTTFRAEGTGDVVMREAPILDRACNSSIDALKLMDPLIRTLQVNSVRMRELASSNWSTATALADDLVREKNLSFRASHAIVARFIRLSLERGQSVKQASGALLDKAAGDLHLPPPNFNDERVRAAFDADTFVRSRLSEGSVSPTAIEVLHDDAVLAAAASQSWLDKTRSRLQDADDELQQAIGRIKAQAGTGS